MFSQGTNSSINSLKILIVEDDINSAFILQTILTRAGYRVLPIATDGNMALNKIDTDDPELILMDITLPGGIDGIETAKLIKQKRDIPVIYLTGQSSEEVIQRVKQTTPFGFILKPYAPKSVLITTEMALHKAAVEKEARETKNRLAVTLGNLRDSVISTDDNGFVSYLNQSAEKHLQMPSAIAVGLQINGLLNLYEAQYPFRKIETFKEFLPNTSHNKGKISYVLSFGKDGEKRLVFVKVNEICDIYNKLTGYVIVLSDFTDQFYFEKNNRMLASSLASIDDGVIVAESNAENEEFNIVYSNNSFGYITGYAPNELIGKPIDFLFCENFDKKLKQSLQEVATLENSISDDTIFVRKDGRTILTNWSISPFYDEDNLIRHIVIIIRDVSNVRQMEETIRQSQKIEAIGRLAGGIAHDFNNLLSVINGYSDILKANLDSKSPYYQYILSISEAGHRGADLVNQLMTFSRHETSSKQDYTILNINTIATNTIRMLSSWIGKDVDIKTLFQSDLWPIKSQETYIDQILVNLCVNAKDAMPNGGTLTIELKNFECIDEKNVFPFCSGKYVVMSVGDTGVGIDDEIQKKIFEPFFTTKPIGKGTGLGLSTVYGLVKKHGGYIRVNSKLGVGSVFEIYIPADESFASITAEKHDNKHKASNSVAIMCSNASLVNCLKNLLIVNSYSILFPKTIEELVATTENDGLIACIIDKLYANELLSKSNINQNITIIIQDNQSKDNIHHSLNNVKIISDDLAITEVYDLIANSKS